MRHLEHAEQVEVVRWLRACGVLFCAVPNGARTSISVAKRLKAEGLEAGAPDLLIFTPPPKFPSVSGVAIEMKAQKGGRLSDEQAEWLASLSAHGWLAKCCRGAVDALTWLAELGYRVPR